MEASSDEEIMAIFYVLGLETVSTHILMTDEEILDAQRTLFSKLLLLCMSKGYLASDYYRALVVSALSKLPANEKTENVKQMLICNNIPRESNLSEWTSFCAWLELGLANPPPDWMVEDMKEDWVSSQQEEEEQKEGQQEEEL